MRGKNSANNERRSRRPSASMVLAVIALVAALAGTGYAASGSLSGKLIKKRSEPGNRFKKNKVTGKEVNANKLGEVPSAAEAQTLQGKAPSDFVPVDKIKRFSVMMSFGETRDIFTAGPLIFTARCVKNGTTVFGDPNRDFLEVLIGTSQNGVVFDGSQSKVGDSGDGSFLNNATPANQRVFFTGDDTATGIRNYDAEDAFVAGAEAPDGTTVSMNLDGMGGAENEFGTDCLLTGTGVVDNG